MLRCPLAFPSCTFCQSQSGPRDPRLGWIGSEEASGPASEPWAVESASKACRGGLSDLGWSALKTGPTVQSRHSTPRSPALHTQESPCVVCIFCMFLPPCDPSLRLPFAAARQSCEHAPSRMELPAASLQEPDSTPTPRGGMPAPRFPVPAGRSSRRTNLAWNKRRAPTSTFESHIDLAAAAKISARGPRRRRGCPSAAPAPRDRLGQAAWRILCDASRLP